MLPYYLIILLICIFLFKKNDTNVYKLLCFLLFAFAIMRGNGSGDYFRYLNYSTLITHLSNLLNFNFPMEIGFRLISFFVNTLSIHRQFVIIIMNTISLLLIFRFIKKNSPDLILSLFLYIPMFFQFEMHATRTAVAYAILTLAYENIEENNKRYKFFIYLILACCFHKSAIIFLIAFILLNKKPHKTIILASLFISYIVTLFINIDYIILNILNTLHLDQFSSKFINYINSVEYGYRFSLFDPRLLICVFTLVFSLLFINKISRRNYNLLIMQWITCLIMILLSNHTIFVTRFSSFFNVYSIILYPNILEIIKKSQSTKNYYTFIKIILIILYLIIDVFILGGYVEYRLFI